MHLRNLWYFALPGRSLKRGTMARQVMLGDPVLIGRDADGKVFALRDTCPHRGVPLSYGQFDGREIECCYHGWRFDPAGRCTAVPSLVEGQSLELDRIRVRDYPAREVQGGVWLFMGDDRTEPADGPPTIPGIGARAPQITETMLFPCGMDHAVIGLMDPAHGPFVHSAWWWRRRGSIHAKAKRFVPSPLGFTMVRHQPSKNAAAYRLLGGQLATEISFRLPGVRIEHIEAGRHVLCQLTAVTPVDERTTRIDHAIWWTQPWLNVLRPVGRYLARAFIGQDRDLIAKQQEGLRFEPPLMLINDADQPAKWYYRLKKEWLRVTAEGGEFANPVRQTELRWRS